MAAFSYHPHPFLLDSFYFPTKPSSFSMDDGNRFGSDSFSQFCSPNHLLHDSPPDPNCHDGSCVVSRSDNEPSVAQKQSTGGGDSTVVDKLENSEEATQKVSLVRNRKRRSRNGTTLNSAKVKDAKGGKNKCNNGKEIGKKPPQDPPTGFIHVRARRGQATDSHSLAERVRRKKISERMKILQCLVPGCEKVTGKALMLDEIINYVQSLQNQVEFLSMRLAAVSPMFYDFGVDLEALTVQPERVNSEASTTAVLPCLQQSNPTQASAFVDSTTATFAPSHNYPLLLHQGQTPIVFSHPHDNGSVLGEVEEDQRRKFHNSSQLHDNLCSFY